MPEFKLFAEQIKENFDKIAKEQLFLVDIPKETIWETYLSSFDPADNPIYIERTEHDCQCCKSFIRSIGRVVAIIDGKLTSIWNVNTTPKYQRVADALKTLIESAAIANVFLTQEKAIGIRSNFREFESHVIKFNHFYCDIPKRYQTNKDSIGTLLGTYQTNQAVLRRGLTELTVDAFETVLDLINQNSLYRGEEFKKAVSAFLNIKKLVPVNNEDIFYWEQSIKLGELCKFRNTAIGTLVTDLSNNIDINIAVASFESKVAPTNYKRPTALITAGMIKEAEKTVNALNIESSLYRRHATISDITINNVLFADRSARKSMGVFDDIKTSAAINSKSLDKIEQVPINTFLENILPQAEKLEILINNNQTNNLMSLIAPLNNDAKKIFKWNNNFSWSYNGNVTDSIKQRVKSAGGNVDGVLRFSIKWNDGDNNQNDFDAHCIEPSRNLIYYGDPSSMKTRGNLDVDIRRPGNKVAVENITWPKKEYMEDGRYIFLVHNFSHNGGTTGFDAEIEYDGKTYDFTYNKELRQNEKVIVAEIGFNKSTGITFIKSLPESSSTKEIWGINTNTFINVATVMNSPNHWDDEETGNKHLFFILDNCLNPDQAKGFYNEFLDNDLNKHRKVFEVLSNKLKVPESNKQLSGVGFSSTKRESVVCRVSGKFNRIIKINF